MASEHRSKPSFTSSETRSWTIPSEFSTGIGSPSCPARARHASYCELARVVGGGCEAAMLDSLCLSWFRRQHGSAPAPVPRRSAEPVAGAEHAGDGTAGAGSGVGSQTCLAQALDLGAQPGQLLRLCVCSFVKRRPNRKHEGMVR